MSKKKYKMSKGDYVKAARRQREQEDIFFTQLNGQRDNDLNNTKKKKHDNKDFVKGDDDYGY